MNCPICGTPLNDTDAFCANCGTKRAEMGAAYNNTQSSPNYGSTNGMYKNGYGNANNYGNTNNYQQGYGMNSRPAAPVRTMNTGMQLDGKKTMALVILAVMILFGALAYTKYINTPQKVRMADVTITLPQRMKKQSSSVFSDSDADGGEFYMNRKVGFAYLKYNIGELDLEDKDVDGLENLFIRLMQSSFEESLDGYEMKDREDDRLRFYFTESGNRFYSDMKIDLHGEDMYMYVVYCKREDENKFVTKFRTMYETIEYN